MSPGKILIVADSEESLKLLSGILGAEGYDFRSADSGELALAIDTANPPELILLDLRMPGMDGIEVCRKLKSCAETRDIPVMLLSGSLDFESRLQGLESGAVDFIDKPFRREELLARLKTRLELARLRKELGTTRGGENRGVTSKSELESRKRAEEELREREEHFRTMMDSAPAGIFLFSESPTYASKWLLTFLASSMEQLANDGWVRFVHPEDVDRLVEEIASAVEEQRSGQIEHRLLRSDGEYRWVTATVNPRFVNGKFAGHIGVLLDITEQKRAQERILERQKRESLGVVAAGIAHNFNNMLSAILAHSALALDEIPNETRAHENVSKITAVALRAAEIVSLLRAYAGSGDSGSSEPVELSPLIQEMVPLLQSSVSPNTSLQVNLSNDGALIQANAAQVREVIIGLTMNATEALEGRRGTVALSTAKMRKLDEGSAESEPPGLGEYVLLKVSDTGCGMTEETKARIFDPFFSTKFLGRGLGLSSAQGIVRKMGGAICVVSAPGQGSTFKVWLPCSDR